MPLDLYCVEIPLRSYVRWRCHKRFELLTVDDEELRVVPISHKTLKIALGHVVMFSGCHRSTGITMDRTHADYFVTSDNERIFLTIVGRDPFPQHATSIPFCKPDWEKQLAGNCSGRHVLWSLGIDTDAAQAQYATPEGLFMALRREGVVFLNASYKLLADYPEERHIGLRREAHQRNLPLLTRARTVVLCGEAKVIRSMVGMADLGIEVVHPADWCRNHAVQSVRDEWTKYWSPGALARELHISVSVIGFQQAVPSERG